MTNDEIGKKIGFLMHYFLDWWTVWQQDNTDTDIDAAYVKETDGGIRFGIQEDGTAIFPTARPSAKKELPAEPEQGENATQAEIGFLESVPILEFTPKEISKMPTFFRKEFHLKGGTTAHIRQKQNGTYEIRYRRNGMNISASAKTIAEAKERFIQALCQAKSNETSSRMFFGQFAMQWLEVVKKPNIKESTYGNYVFTLKTYVFPKFGKMRIRDIKPLVVQSLLNDLEKRGLQRSVENVYVLLKAIFDFAIAENLIVKSPMAPIRKPKHETKHGCALTVEEEHAFVERCIASNAACRYAYILMVFTGIRRSEFSSVKFSPQWITVTTSKTRKGMPEKQRKIPVSPMLKPFLPFMTPENLNVNPDMLTRGISRLLPGHHLHELRHTFITRCQECGISRELTSLWAGHKADNTMTSNVYTHFSEEYQLGEIKKLRY